MTPSPATSTTSPVNGPLRPPASTSKASTPPQPSPGTRRRTAPPRTSTARSKPPAPPSKTRWRDLSQTKRGRLLRNLADLIGDHAEELARTETLDNGKLLREMRAQLAGLPEYFHYYAGLADKIHGEVIPGASRDLLNYTLREPVGVVGAITPWNSPSC